MKKQMTFMILFAVLLSSCGGGHEVSADQETFSISELLIEGHAFLDKCPFWHIRIWEPIEGECGEILNTYSEYDGVNGTDIVYKEAEGITYVIFDDYPIAVILTDATYSLGAGFTVGDEIDQSVIERYHFTCYDRGTSEQECISYMENAEKGPSSMFEYDWIYYTETFISENENRDFRKELSFDNAIKRALFSSCGSNVVKISLYVKENRITGICVSL